MKRFGMVFAALICGALFAASPSAAQQLTKEERALALKLTSELEAKLDQSCLPVVDQIRTILDDFHSFQLARKTIVTSYAASIKATRAELDRPFLELEKLFEAFKLRALQANILLGEDVVEEIRDPELDDINIFGIPMEGLALTASSIEKVEELTPELNQLRLAYDALVAEHRERAKRMANRFNSNLKSGFEVLDQLAKSIQAQKDSLIGLFGDESGPFAHCLGYSNSTKDKVGKLVGIPALVTPISKVLGLNVRAPEPVENIGERLVQLGVLEPPPEPKVEIKRNGEQYLELFAELLEARNEGDAVMVKVGALNAVAHVLETAKNFTYGLLLGPFEPFTRDDLTVMQAFYQAGKDMTVGAVQGAVDSFSTVIKNEQERGEELYKAIGGGNNLAVAAFADFGGAMQAVLSVTNITLNQMKANDTPKRSDHVDGIVGLVAYVDELRFHNDELKELIKDTDDSVEKFNRAVDTWMAVFQIALTFEGGKATVQNAKNLGGKIKSDGALKGTNNFVIERSTAFIDQTRLRFEQGKAIARKGKDSIVAAKNLLSRKKLGEDIPADAETIARNVLDEQKRIEEALESETSIAESTAFLERQFEASKEFSGTRFVDEVTDARPTPNRPSRDSTPTLIIEPDPPPPPPTGGRDLGVVEGATPGKPDLPPAIRPEDQGDTVQPIEIAPQNETFALNDGRQVDFTLGGQSRSGQVSDVFLGDDLVVKLVKNKPGVDPNAAGGTNESVNRIETAANVLNDLDAALEGTAVGATRFLGSKEITVQVKEVGPDGQVVLREETRTAQIFEKFETKSKNNEIVQGFADDILNQQGAFTAGQVKAMVLGKIFLADFGVLLRDFKPDNFGLVKIGEPDSWKIHITDIDMIRQLGDTRTAGGLAAETPKDIRKLANTRIRGKSGPLTQQQDVRIDSEGVRRFDGNIGVTKDALDKGIATAEGEGSFKVNPDDKLANELLDKFVDDPDGAIQDIFGNDETAIAAIDQKRAVIQKQGEERAQKLREEQLALENAERAEAETAKNDAEVSESIETALPKLDFDTDGEGGGGGGGFNLSDFDTDGEIGGNQTFDAPSGNSFLTDTDNGESGGGGLLTDDGTFGTDKPDFGSLFGDLFKDKGEGGDAGPQADGGS